MRVIESIIVHHTATPPSTTVDEIRQMHMARGWRDIGYHYLIDHAGVLHDGRPVAQVGAHCRGYNEHSIGVALIGTFTTWFEVPGAQRLALERHLHALARLYFPVTVWLHRELADTICPGFTARDMFCSMILR